MLVYGDMPDSIFADYAKTCKFLHFESWESFIKTEEGRALLKPRRLLLQMNLQKLNIKNEFTKIHFKEGL